MAETLGTTCAACGHVNEAEKKFCSECGEKLEQGGGGGGGGTCPACGHVNQPGVKFCGGCGQLLGTETTISLDKEAYASKEEIVITVKGITALMKADGAFVGLYLLDAAHDQWLGYRSLDEGDSTRSYEAPFDGGDYEFRLFRRDRQYDDASVVMRVPFKVEEELCDYDAVTMELDKPSYVPGDQVIVTIKNVPERMQRDNAFVGPYDADAPHDTWKSYRSLAEGENTFTFDTDIRGGSFEMRLFRRDRQYDDESLLICIPYKVGGSLICPKCGFRNADDTKFCNECGTGLDAPQGCPACGAAIEPGMKFCGDCGAKF